VVLFPDLIIIVVVVIIIIIIIRSVIKVTGWMLNDEVRFLALADVFLFAMTSVLFVGHGNFPTWVKRTERVDDHLTSF
jgi:hypothetical protein